MKGAEEVDFQQTCIRDEFMMAFLGDYSIAMVLRYIQTAIISRNIDIMEGVNLRDQALAEL